MFSSILTWLSTNVGDMFTFFGDLLAGPVSMFYDSTGGALTDLGELLLMGALVGLGLFAIKWVRSVIPFLR